MQQVLPFLEYWYDLEADFLRFYGIDISDTGTVEAARFFRLASRLAVYEGMLTARIREEQERTEKSSKPRSANRAPGEVKNVPIKALATMESGVIDFK